ncbi:hypothetical protein SANTM175S_06015 [Streptomyces antimycoticus]
MPDTRVPAAFPELQMGVLVPASPIAETLDRIASLVRRGERPLDRVADVIRRNRVVLIAADHLATASDGAELARELEPFVAERIRRAAAQDAATGLLDRLGTELGIPVWGIKGLSSRADYPEPKLRELRDADVCVAGAEEALALADRLRRTVTARTMANCRGSNRPRTAGPTGSTNSRARADSPPWTSTSAPATPRATAACCRCPRRPNRACARCLRSRICGRCWATAAETCTSPSRTSTTSGSRPGRSARCRGRRTRGRRQDRCAGHAHLCRHAGRRASRRTARPSSCRPTGRPGRHTGRRAGHGAHARSLPVARAGSAASDARTVRGCCARSDRSPVPAGPRRTHVDAAAGAALGGAALGSAGCGPRPCRPVPQGGPEGGPRWRGRASALSVAAGRARSSSSGTPARRRREPRALAPPGTQVVVERPSFLGVVTAFERCGARVLQADLREALRIARPAREHLRGSPRPGATPTAGAWTGRPPTAWPASSPTAESWCRMRRTGSSPLLGSVRRACGCRARSSLGR